MRITRIIVFHIIGVLLVLGACAKSVPNPRPGHNEVWFIAIEKFTPSTITVPVGTTVTWTNKDQKLHTVTSADGLFNRTLSPGNSFSYNFTENGVFIYFDEFDESHREQEATVYVQ